MSEGGETLSNLGTAGLGLILQFSENVYVIGNLKFLLSTAKPHLNPIRVCAVRTRYCISGSVWFFYSLYGHFTRHLWLRR